MTPFGATLHGSTPLHHHRLSTYFPSSSSYQDLESYRPLLEIDFDASRPRAEPRHKSVSLKRPRRASATEGKMMRNCPPLHYSSAVAKWSQPSGDYERAFRDGFRVGGSSFAGHKPSRGLTPLKARELCVSFLSSLPSAPPVSFPTRPPLSLPIAVPQLLAPSPSSNAPAPGLSTSPVCAPFLRGVGDDEMERVGVGRREWRGFVEGCSVLLATSNHSIRDLDELQYLPPPPYEGTRRGSHPSTLHSFLASSNTLIFHPRSLSVSLVTSPTLSLMLGSSERVSDLTDQELIEVWSMDAMQRRIWPVRSAAHPIRLSYSPSSSVLSPDLDPLYARALTDTRLESQKHAAWWEREGKRLASGSVQCGRREKVEWEAGGALEEARGALWLVVENL